MLDARGFSVVLGLMLGFLTRVIVFTWTFQLQRFERNLVWWFLWIIIKSRTSLDLLKMSKSSIKRNLAIQFNSFLLKLRGEYQTLWNSFIYETSKVSNFGTVVFVFWWTEQSKVSESSIAVTLSQVPSCNIFVALQNEFLRCRGL